MYISNRIYLKRYGQEWELRFKSAYLKMLPFTPDYMMVVSHPVDTYIDKKRLCRFVPNAVRLLMQCACTVGQQSWQLAGNLLARILLLGYGSANRKILCGQDDWRDSAICPKFIKALFKSAGRKYCFTVLLEWKFTREFRNYYSMRLSKDTNY